MAEDTKSQRTFRQWYEENRDELNQRRRERYRSDPKYRKRVRQWNETTRQKRMSDRRREARETHLAVKMRTAGMWKTILHEVDGVQVPMFTIGALSKVLGRGISTLRVWERNGVLPKTPYRSARGDRLYTLEMVEQVEKALRRAGRLDIEVLKDKDRPAFVVKKVYFPKLDEVVELRLYKVGALAKAVGKTVAALAHMEQKGALPRTPLLASGLGYRLYTLDMIEAVQRVLRAHGGSVRGSEESGSFYDEIVQEWTKLGMMDAEVQG